jgi:predicted alpha/beta-hydrolase family hydrolase
MVMSPILIFRIPGSPDVAIKRSGRFAAVQAGRIFAKARIVRVCFQTDESETTAVTPQELKLNVDGSGVVSALLLRPSGAQACYVFAHGAGAGMTHAFMERVAAGLCDRGVATLRYQFPYMENGSRRPDAPPLAHAAVRAAVAEAARSCPGLALFAGGKSFGGRMTSQAQAVAPLAGVRGLAFLGFPLHPAGKPSDTRAGHLGDVHVPMLFIQGTRDKLAELPLLEPVVKRLGPSASLHRVAEADHTFHVLARSGRNDLEVMSEIVEQLSVWIAASAAP